MFIPLFIQCASATLREEKKKKTIEDKILKNQKKADASRTKLNKKAEGIAAKLQKKILSAAAAKAMKNKKSPKLVVN